MSIENDIFYENFRKISKLFLCIFTYPVKAQDAVGLKGHICCIVGHEKHRFSLGMRLYESGCLKLVFPVYALERLVKHKYAEICAERADYRRSPLHSSRKFLYGTGYILP